MTDRRPPSIAVGSSVESADGRQLGLVDAVFVDYLLVRTPGWLPTDLYVPTAEIGSADGDRVTLRARADEVHARGWHRPLRRVAHDEP